ncbi:MAG: double-cubane-cluster-containing anaerobic reductase [Candidatus Bathyarchaeota archaeon]|nr:double-cubane-cluster-containing anaerobic reductase [Candidatus Bathyarchaeum sp.]
MASEIEKGTKYIPEMTQSEIDDLNKSMKTSSLKVIEDNIEKMKKSWKDRPQVMEYFDEISNLFGKRQEEIKQQKATGKKVIGYSCIFAPIEMILAADAIPVRVGSGWYDSAKLGDRIMPVEVCPVIRSTVGAKMVNLSPFLELSDAIVMPLTCDGRTKLSEMLADHKPIWRMNPPRVKDDPHTLSMWKQEIMVIKEKIEKLTGNKIDRKNLKTAIEKMQQATKAFRRLQELRKGNPVINGRDAMLVNQTSLWDDIERWTQKVNELCDELEKRLEQKEYSTYPDTPRVMLTGTPMIWPDSWKVPNLIEESNPQGVVVVDEQCSGDRILYDPVGVDEWTMSDMIDAIGERYLMACTCPCFTSEHGNEDRINWIIDRIKEYKVDGVIYYVVRGCILYAMEYQRIKNVLDKMNIPVYYLDTEYTREDVGQMKTRVEAFLEMLEARMDI